ncbi:MAG: hypothetical protein AB7E37_07105 [Candidatus Altimarinota bacterium]
MPIKNDWTNKNNKSEKNNNPNLNFNNDENNHSIGILIISISAIVFTYFLYNYIQDKKREEIIQTQKEINEYNKKVRAHNERLSKEKEEIKNYYSKKGFNFNTEINKSSYDDSYNFNIIIDNLKQVVSDNEDNNYKIEIIGNISSYGNMFYKIYKINSNDKYDNDFNKILEELKKVKYRVRNYDTNFKITIHNNDYDLN